VNLRAGEPVIERARVQRRPSWLYVWLPVLIWTGVIALESSIGSSGNTAPVLLWISQKLIGNMSADSFATLHHVVRKCGHFFGYGILGVLWFRALGISVGRNRRIALAVALAATFVTASIDEWHQSFSSARTAAFSDVLLDTMGAAVLIALFMLLRRRPSHYETSMDA
jgi:VanZ family protein